jgi:hypothetical protein
MPPLNCSQITIQPNSFISLALVQSLTNDVLCLGTCKGLDHKKFWKFVISLSSGIQLTHHLFFLFISSYCSECFLSPLGSSIPLHQISLDFLWLHRPFCSTKPASLKSDKASCQLPWVLAWTFKFDGKPKITVSQATKTIEHEWWMVD